MSSHIEIKAGAFVYRFTVPAQFTDALVQEMFLRYAESMGATPEMTPAEKGQIITSSWAKDIQSISINTYEAQLNAPLIEAHQDQLEANHQTAIQRFTF